MTRKRQYIKTNNYANLKSGFIITYDQKYEKQSRLDILNFIDYIFDEIDDNIYDINELYYDDIIEQNEENEHQDNDTPKISEYTAEIPVKKQKTTIDLLQAEINSIQNNHHQHIQIIKNLSQNGLLLIKLLNKKIDPVKLIYKMIKSPIKSSYIYKYIPYQLICYNTQIKRQFKLFIQNYFQKKKNIKVLLYI